MKDIEAVQVCLSPSMIWEDNGRGRRMKIIIEVELMVL